MSGGDGGWGAMSSNAPGSRFFGKPASPGKQLAIRDGGIKKHSKAEEVTARYRKDMQKDLGKQKNITCINPGKLVPIETDDLDEGERLGQPTEQEWAEENERRKKCKLTYLMAYAPDHEVLRYADIALQCLRDSSVYPFPAPEFDPVDTELGAEALDIVMTQGNIMYQKNLIWMALYLSREFVSVFCPRPSASGNREFLVNPEILGAFISGKKSPLIAIVSSMLINNIGVDHMGPAALEKWMELRPWADHEVWSKLQADGSGGELVQMAICDERRDATLARIEAAGKGPLLLEDGDAD